MRNCIAAFFKGKNGLWRSVPSNEQVRIALRDSLARTNPGQKLFVPQGEKTHEVIKELEAFIREHREMIRFPDSNRTAKLTFRGLRHSYVAEQYTRLRKSGDTDKKSCMKLAPLLGHSRPDVVHVYLTKALVAQFEKGGDGNVCVMFEQIVVANGGIQWYNIIMSLRAAASEGRFYS